MRVRTSIIVLGWTLIGVFGCAPRVVRNHEFGRQPWPEVVPEVAARQPAPSLIPALPTPPLAPEQSIREETLAAPAPKENIVTAASSADKKTASANPREKPAKELAESLAVVAKAARVSADDRLLDLVEKEIEKAVEQPAERRHLQFSKEVIENPKVRGFVRYFSKTNRKQFEILLARSGRYLPMIAQILSDEGLPEELAYIALIESGFMTNTISAHGAAGLWQFVPETARKYGLKLDPWIDERRDPIKSTRAASAYLKDLHKYFGRWYLTTAAYNAGQGTINRAMQKSGAKDFWSLSDGAQLGGETRDFVPKFVAVSLIATNPKKYGFSNVRYEKPMEYEEVEVRAPMKLEAVAELAGTDVEAVRNLNPQLIKSQTPPGDNPFRIKLPAGTAVAFAKAQSEPKEIEKETAGVQVVTHEVKKGETLFSIARHYSQEVKSLMELNGLTSARLRIGQKLMILLEGLRETLR